MSSMFSGLRFLVGDSERTAVSYVESTHTQQSTATIELPARARRATYELVGPPDAPVIVALGGISATRHVTASADDPSLGWWESIVGNGRPIDTAHFRVLRV